ncbi:Zn-ribbon domain-containing OB-fold protein [Salinigranum halophilum]|jgi:hypothetical protein|uniref:Zn-ribbon domain-containing OB-fold protein n=1 Tax=Salinigranum halophilum TaxID=2565931 RepID=UPI00115C976C|nr:OB-fold domain-containing protein [Salinigranum halophilum]
MKSKARDDGYDDLLDAVEEGEPYYLACANGHGSLPPRRTCPHCGGVDLSEEPLPESGTVETFTTTQVAAPSFSSKAPYTTAVVDFGPVRVTGIVRADAEDIEVGMRVGLAVGRNTMTGNRMLTFHPR